MIKKIIPVALIAASISALFAFKTLTTATPVTVIITHEVKDYTIWKKGFDADEPNRKMAGVNVSAVYTSIDKPNEVTVIADAPSPEFLANPQLKEAMEKAGVISKPEIKLLYKK